MKRVPADEFAEHAAAYLEGDEPISVEKDGEEIGRYVPMPNGHTMSGARSGDRTSDEALLGELENGISPESLATIRRLDGLLQSIYDRTGLTEDELAEYFDLTKPIPPDHDDVS